MEFPIFNTKELSDGNVYDLNDPASRHKYFKAKLGDKIEEMKNYLDHNAFIGFLLAKKSAGKGTYSKMMQEIVGGSRVHHISVGDIVRDVHKAIEEKSERRELESYLEKYYRGFISIETALDAFTKRTQDKLIPTEFILTLVKREIEKVGRKALFIDGLPRSLDQISYSLYFRDLIHFSGEPDFFVLIDVPTTIIDERMKYRRICPVCNTSKNLKLNPTSLVGYSEKDDVYYLICDNKSCSGYMTQAYVTKEGDDKGVDLIRERLETDGELMKRALDLRGIPRILLRNAIPIGIINDYAEDYEITPEFYYERDEKKIVIKERPWSVNDDDGIESGSLLPAAVVVSLFSQIHKTIFG